MFPSDRDLHEAQSHAYGYHSGSGRTPIVFQPLVTQDDYFRTITGHRREILVVIALFGPLMVSEIAERLQLLQPVVSRELRRLQKGMLVEWMQIKSRHVFRLSDRIQAFKWQGKLQLGVRFPNGDWVWSHCEEYSEQGAPVPPPRHFIQGEPEAELIGESSTVVPQRVRGARSVHQTGEWSLSNARHSPESQQPAEKPGRKEEKRGKRPEQRAKSTRGRGAESRQSKTRRHR